MRIYEVQDRNQQLLEVPLGCLGKFCSGNALVSFG